MVSDEYIRMCQTAKEVQDIWEPKEGDLIFNWKFQEFMKTKNRDYFFKPMILETEALCCVPNPVEFWLPRQEDIIQILSKTWLVSEAQVLLKFIDYVEDMWIKGLGYEPEAINMFWLSFYMHMEYSKTWTGNDWVKL